MLEPITALRAVRDLRAANLAAHAGTVEHYGLFGISRRVRAAETQLTLASSHATRAADVLVQLGREDLAGRARSARGVFHAALADAMQGQREALQRAELTTAADDLQALAIDIRTDTVGLDGTQAEAARDAVAAGVHSDGDVPRGDAQLAAIDHLRRGVVPAHDDVVADAATPDAVARLAELARRGTTSLSGDPARAAVVDLVREPGVSGRSVDLARVDALLSKLLVVDATPVEQELALAVGRQVGSGAATHAANASLVDDLAAIVVRRHDLTDPAAAAAAVDRVLGHTGPWSRDDLLDIAALGDLPAGAQPLGAPRVGGTDLDDLLEVIDTGTHRLPADVRDALAWQRSMRGVATPADAAALAAPLVGVVDRDWTREELLRWADLADLPATVDPLHGTPSGAELRDLAARSDAAPGSLHDAPVLRALRTSVAHIALPTPAAAEAEVTRVVAEVHDWPNLTPGQWRRLDRARTAGSSSLAGLPESTFDRAARADQPAGTSPLDPQGWTHLDAVRAAAVLPTREAATTAARTVLERAPATWTRSDLHVLQGIDGLPDDRRPQGLPQLLVAGAVRAETSRLAAQPTWTMEPALDAWLHHDEFPNAGAAAARLAELVHHEPASLDGSALRELARIRELTPELRPAVADGLSDALRDAAREVDAGTPLAPDSTVGLQLHAVRARIELPTRDAAAAELARLASTDRTARSDDDWARITAITQLPDDVRPLGVQPYPKLASHIRQGSPDWTLLRPIENAGAALRHADASIATRLVDTLLQDGVAGAPELRELATMASLPPDSLPLDLGRYLRRADWDAGAASLERGVAIPVAWDGFVALNDFAVAREIPDRARAIALARTTLARTSLDGHDLRTLSGILSLPPDRALLGAPPRNELGAAALSLIHQPGAQIASWWQGHAQIDELQAAVELQAPGAPLRTLRDAMPAVGADPLTRGTVRTLERMLAPGELSRDEQVGLLQLGAATDGGAVTYAHATEVQREEAAARAQLAAAGTDPATTSLGAVVPTHGELRMTALAGARLHVVRQVGIAASTDLPVARGDVAGRLDAALASIDLARERSIVDESNLDAVDFPGTYAALTEAQDHVRAVRTPLASDLPGIAPLIDDIDTNLQREREHLSSSLEQLELGVPRRQLDVAHGYPDHGLLGRTRVQLTTLRSVVELSGSNEHAVGAAPESI